MSFLSDLSNYNTLASNAIVEASLCCEFEKVNLYSSLLSTANDTTLSNDIRLNALTALINAADLLNIAAPPLFLRTTTYSPTVAYTGFHNDLDGLNDGTTYLHVTSDQISYWNSKADSASVSFATLQGLPSENPDLQAALDAKQNLLPNGVGFIKVNGTAVSVDTNTYLTAVTGAAGGDLTGTYPNPTITSTTILSKVLTGFNPSAAAGSVTSSSTILGALETLNANINAVSAASGTVTSVSLTLPTTVFSAAVGPFTTTAALSLSFISQTQGRVFAAPSGSNGVPVFRALAATDLPAVGSVTPGTYSLATVTVDGYGRVTGVASGSVVGTGTVTSVGISPPAQFSAGSPITTSGNLTFAWASNPTPNLVFATPAAAAGVPIFRSLVVADIPGNIPQSKIANLVDDLGNKLTNSLSNGSIWVGSNASVPTPRLLSQDIEMTNFGIVTIQPNVVSFDKMQQIVGADIGAGTPGNIVGRWSAGTGNIEEIALSGQFTTAGGILDLTAPVTPVLTTAGSLITWDSTLLQQVEFLAGSNGQILIPNNTLDTGLEWVTLGGDISIDTVTPSGTVTISNNAVTLGKMALITGPKIFGNFNSGAGLSVLAMTGAEAVTILPTFSTSTTDKGLVGGSNGVGATYYLNATGGWTVPAGGGGGGTTTNALTINNSGSGAASPITFNGSAAVTISYNTIGAQASSASLTSLAALSYASTAFVKMTGANTFSLDTTTYLSGTVSLTNGGTNANNTAVNGGVAYSTASAINITAAGTTAGQIFQSNVASAPTWSTATYPATTIANKILYSSANNVVGEIVAPTSADTFLKWTGSAFTWAGAGSGSGTVTSANQYSIPYYSLTPANTTLTGLTPDIGTNGSKFLSQVITSGNAAAPVWVQSTGSGSVVLDTSPALTTPNIGDAIADSINNVVITATASTTTLTIANTKAFTVSNTLTFTGADNSSVAFGAGGTVAYIDLANSWTSGIKQTFAPSATTAGINVGTLAGQPSSPANGDLVYNSSATALQAYINGAWVSLGAGGGGGSGTVNSGTQYQLAYYATAGTAVSGLTTGTSGQVLALSAGLVPTWTTLGTSTTLTNIGAATATATLANANSTITWNWNSNTSSNAFVLGSTSITTGNLLTLGISGSTAVSAENLVITNSSTANTSGRGLDISITNTTTNAVTFGAVISNTKTATGTGVNTALQLTASGATTNYALDVTAGIVRMAASTASLPHMIFSPGAAALTASTNGMLSYATVSSNSSFYLYKDSAVTTILTKDRNPEFVTGAQGVVVADASGNFTKSADLTALGIFAAYNTTTLPNTTLTATTMVSGSLVGSKTLPANFFALGKTIVFKASGIITLDNSRTFTFRTSLGATLNIDVVLDHSNVITNGYWDYTCSVTCKAISGTNSTYIYSAQVVCVHNNTSGENVMFGAAADSGSIAVNTGATIAVDILGNFSGTTAGDTFTAYQATSQYLN